MPTINGVLVFGLLATIGFAQSPKHELKALYEAHHWPELRSRLG